jgi:acid phosphatase (class A)
MKTKWNFLCLHLLLMLVSALSACSTTPPDTARTTSVVPPGEQVREIMPGLLEGYLSKGEQLDSKEFVPPSPNRDSALQKLDTDWSRKMLELRGTARWDLAISDADLSFPAAADVFSCALGISINEQNTPALYMLLRRTLTDVGLAPYSAKNAYQRERPFMVNEEPVCTPQDEEALRKDGSYPSGHTAIGWGWALILSELSPDQAEAILARGRSFGESRNVCNAHWYSDVVAGRLVGAAAVARLHTNEQFLEAMAAAREDIVKARKSGLVPNSGCETEADALATPLQ